LAIDDNSLEILKDKYGAWPWDRIAYVEAIDFLEKAGAKQIVLDLMFVNNSDEPTSDKKLINSIKKNQNVYAAMNLDDISSIEHPQLPKHLEANVTNNGAVQFPVYKNYRPILSELINETKNIGMINCQRDFDGISRGTPSFVGYKNSLYPYLGLKAAADYLNIKEFKITKENDLILNGKKYQLQPNGYMILNWYNNSFNSVPFWQMKKNPSVFKDKIVFIGVTANSMYDIKSTPISSNVAGIELQSTLFNNILDNNIIKRTSSFTTWLIAVLLGILIGIFTLNSNTAFASLSLFGATLGGYWLIALILMDYSNLWIDTTFTSLALVLTFIVSYVIKYKNKSKDFDYTYKLATTDSMTGLYNHRFFQEQMTLQIENAKRYNGKFSLILIDIDFFKKFNDTYGHQAGDAVLKQVAELLKKSVRTSDIVARYGGEEMAIILPNNDFDHAVIAADKICKKIASTPFQLNAKVTTNVTISLGVSTFPDNGETPQELIEYSDKGLYAAKESGRNQVGKI
jgi:diguanylate cyclase (GGDEF)-like protein